MSARKVSSISSEMVPVHSDIVELAEAGILSAVIYAIPFDPIEITSTKAPFGSKRHLKASPPSAPLLTVPSTVLLPSFSLTGDVVWTEAGVVTFRVASSPLQ